MDERWKRVGGELWVMRAVGIQPCSSSVSAREWGREGGRDTDVQCMGINTEWGIELNLHTHTHTNALNHWLIRHATTRAVSSLHFAQQPPFEQLTPHWTKPSHNVRSMRIHTYTHSAGGPSYPHDCCSRWSFLWGVWPALVHKEWSASSNRW